MASTVAQLKSEWKHFKNDEPGERFEHQHDRMQRRSRAFAAVTLGLGILLLAVGIALCFIPGPGTPLIVFGLALIGARWLWLAKKLDRAEPKVRSWGRRLKQKWKRHK